MPNTNVNSTVDPPRSSASEGAPAFPSPELQACLPWLLATSIVAAYLPSLFGGFLNWDDPWLIQQNPIWQDAPPFKALAAIWTDLSKPTRLVLGAEYLPIRDMTHWLEGHTYGLNPHRMRVGQLGLYVVAMLLFRRALLLCLGRQLWVELAAWIFALHPVHAESAAWLAGRKDVLALVFIGWTLCRYAAKRTDSWAEGVLLGLLLVGAALSKSMSVAAIALLPALDLLRGAQPRWRCLIGATTGALVTVPLHLYVGQVVGMTTAPAGGDRVTALMTMGPVILRYMGCSLWPPALSLYHDVPILVEWTLLGVAGWLIAISLLLLGLVACRRGRPWPLALVICFLAPLAPVSQVLAPLQNLMADRYLFLSVIAPALAVGLLLRRWSQAWRPVALLLPLLWLSCAHRAWLLSDSQRAFTHAVAMTQLSPKPSYQLAMAWQERGDMVRAEESYRQAIERDGATGSSTGRKASNNLARILAGTGRPQEAAALLERASRRWPDADKIAGNLAQILGRLGRNEERRALCGRILSRWPQSSGARRCRQPSASSETGEFGKPKTRAAAIE